MRRVMFQWAGIAALAGAWLFVHTGCVTPDPSNGDPSNTNTNGAPNSPGNDKPIANAGPDGSYVRSWHVKLNAAQSSDADGDALTYLWEQVSGTPVALTNAATVQAEFDTPDFNDTLVFKLTVNDGKGGIATDLIEVKVIRHSPLLYLIRNVQGVNLWEVDAGVDGDIEPMGLIEAGAATSVFRPRSLAYLNNDTLLVGREQGGIVGFHAASEPLESPPADFVIEGAGTLLQTPIAMTYDRTNDRLFVGEFTALRGILVYDNASTTIGAGNGTPTRTFVTPDRAPADPQQQPMNVQAFALDAAGRLYVADFSRGNRSFIHVFDQAATATGGTAPNRTITTTNSWIQINAMHVDAADTLFLTDGDARVKLLSAASTRSGAVATDGFVELNVSSQIANSNPVELEGLAVGSDGIAYLGDQGNGAVLTVVNLKAKSGGVIVPDAVLEGVNAKTGSARTVLLIERD